MATALLLPVLFQTFSFFFFFLATLLYNTNKYTSDSFLRQQPRPPRSAAAPSCRKPAARPPAERGKTAAPPTGANPHTKIKRHYSWQQGTFPKDTFPPPARATLSPPRHGGKCGPPQSNLLFKTSIHIKCNSNSLSLSTCDKK